MQAPAAIETPVLVIGAGPAGLAVAGALIQQGIRPELIERSGDVATSWRNHYRRLHLHTVKQHSALPHLPFPAAFPRYVPRQQVVDYLAGYAQHFGIAPHFGQEARSIRRGADGRWHTQCASGLAFISKSVVLATGANATPNMPTFPGQEGFGGEILHSRDYREAAPFSGRSVLVVGMGNTGAEIALDLAEQGVQVTLAVRSPLNIVRRDVLGRPTQVTALLLARLPTPVADWIALAFRKMTVGDLSRYGIQTSGTAPNRQLREEGRTPVIDIGTVEMIKKGRIAVRPGIERFTPQGVRFTDGREEAFDAVIMATGFRSRVAELFPGIALEIDDKGLPKRVIGQGDLEQAYFVGYDIRQAGGVLRSIRLEALEVAGVIGKGAG